MRLQEKQASNPTAKALTSASRGLVSQPKRNRECSEAGAPDLASKLREAPERLDRCSDSYPFGAKLGPTHTARLDQKLGVIVRLICRLIDKVLNPSGYGDGHL